MDKISALDFKVLLTVCKYVNYGNVISLTQQNIADDLGIKQSQVSKSFKKLENAGVFYKNKSSLYLNPNYLAKGDLAKSKESEACKIVRNKLYQELALYYNGKELEEKVYELMAF